MPCGFAQYVASGCDAELRGSSIPAILKLRGGGLEIVNVNEIARYGGGRL